MKICYSKGSIIVTAVLALVTSCVPYRETPAPQPVLDAPVAREITQQEKVSAAPEPETIKSVRNLPPQSSPRFMRVSAQGITFEGVAFDARSHVLNVVDQAAGPASQYPDAESVGKKMNAHAAINGGFFDPAGNPLGMVLSNEKKAGAWNSGSSICSGVWSLDGNGHSSIQRREVLGKSRAVQASHLLQAGPMLIDAGKSVSGLNGTQKRARSILLWDGGVRWWMGCTSPCSLAELSKILQNARPLGWQPMHALNLDGGSSSDLWISSNISGGPQSIRSFFSKPVRNFLILVPKR